MSSELQMSVRPVLGVEAARRYRKLGWSWLAILDFVVIGGLMGFVHSDLIFAPGQSIELPRSGNVESRRIEAVLTVSGDLYLFDGQVFRAENIEDGFKAFFEENEKLKGRSTILIKMDAQAPSRALLDVCEQAQTAGFAAVHVAENPEEETTNSVFPN
ncbi:MAG: ExbD/TolR family protein [Opitutales bacterium]